MSNIDPDRNVAFLQYTLEELPGRFLLVRTVNEYATHWLDHEGVWQALPEEDEDIAQLFAGFAENAFMLPSWENANDK
jgi:hypothetical protein